MKISEAILKGCEIVPRQSIGNYFQYGYDNKGRYLFSACAVGAALLAVGYDPMAGKLASMIEYGAKIEGFENTRKRFPIDMIIINCNDRFGWTREQIAAALAREGN